MALWRLSSRLIPYVRQWQQNRVLKNQRSFGNFLFRVHIWQRIRMKRRACRAVIYMIKTMGVRRRHVPPCALLAPHGPLSNGERKLGDRRMIG